MFSTSHKSIEILDDKIKIKPACRGLLFGNCKLISLFLYLRKVAYVSEQLEFSKSVINSKKIKYQEHKNRFCSVHSFQTHF